MIVHPLILMLASPLLSATPPLPIRANEPVKFNFRILLWQYEPGQYSIQFSSRALPAGNDANDRAWVESKPLVRRGGMGRGMHGPLAWE